MPYIHENSDWPDFTWSSVRLTARLAALRHRQGRLIGRMEELGFPLREEAVLRTLTTEVLKSSEIEGAHLSEEQVRSSLARRLGMSIAGLVPADRDVEGVVEMMVDATQNFARKLTAERLFAWHAALFPTGRSGLHRIITGTWRNENSGPMQVVSGPMGRERVHFEAPHATRIESEMKTFLAWFENSTIKIDPVLKAAVAHLWVVTIHPFEDGNGRIARAIAELALARSEQTAQRFYSMSAQIRLERNAYYEMLEATQKGGLDITTWLVWFLDCLDKAFVGAETILASVLQKARFWEAHAGEKFNDRQRAIINRLHDGFEGKLTSSKWAALAKSSQDTALRDIDDLLKRRILAKEAAGGRSTSYQLIKA
ncbi:MAG: Fic family protein [Aestuariivirga sp.]|nr:Fic family protein [Aestuariivirga sp.]